MRTRNEVQDTLPQCTQKGPGGTSKVLGQEKGHLLAFVGKEQIVCGQELSLVKEAAPSAVNVVEGELYHTLVDGATSKLVGTNHLLDQPQELRLVEAACTAGVPLVKEVDCFIDPIHSEL
jgi:hypothetical protein